MNNIEPTPAVDPSPVSLVTGAASGIGRAVAARMAADGHRIVLLDRNPEALRRTAASLRESGAEVRTRPLDLRDGPAVEAAFSAAVREFGRLDRVAQCAGMLVPGGLLEITDQDLLDHLSVNTLGVLHVLQSCARHLDRGGSVVVIGSNAARVPRTGMAAYAASKAAAAALTRCAGLELAAQGIRCNVVEPGSTRTAMQRDLWPDPVAGERAALTGDPEAFRLGIPLGRIAEPDDVAEVVCFLLGPAARHVTLQQLFVDGGASL